MAKKILIVALAKDWTGISRLPGGLKRAGFTVSALCPRGSFLSRTRYLDELMVYPIFTYTRAKFIYALILTALVRFQPDIVIPGDEDALLALQNLSKLLAKTPFKKYADLIRNSIAPAEFDALMLNKSRFVEACQGWGVPTPKNVRVQSMDEALKRAPEFGYPLVLKFDFGYGASGVSICRNEEDLKKGYAKFKAGSFSSRVKSLLKGLFFVTQPEADNFVSLQQYVKGQVGQVPFCSFKGRVFAANPMLKFMTYPGETGPTSVSKGIEKPEMVAAAHAVAENLKFTGFGSLDYIIDEKTQKAYVIELNPRPIPTCHFGPDLCSVNICESFYAGMNSLEIPEKPYKPFMVALFPNEQKRDPQSPYLTEAYHDVPQNDPDLVNALIGR